MMQRKEDDDEGCVLEKSKRRRREMSVKWKERPVLFPSCSCTSSSSSSSSCLFPRVVSSCYEPPHDRPFSPRRGSKDILASVSNTRSAGRSSLFLSCTISQTSQADRTGSLLLSDFSHPIRNLCYLFRYSVRTLKLEAAGGAEEAEEYRLVPHSLFTAWTVRQRGPAQIPSTRRWGGYEKGILWP